ncbi:MAG: superoxide dismutase [Planctomycetota bacterium]|jgi:Fe-Mn family superoxide dismutase
MAFELPDLPYAHDALEPIIDATTMQIHHGKHHAAYVAKLNAALEGHDDLLAMSIEELCRNLDRVPEAARTAVRNNGGGHCNHAIFWTTMAPAGSGGGGAPTGDLAAAIDAACGSFDGFKQAFADAAANRFGSGWAWLARADDGSVFVTSTPNQDNPLMSGLVDRPGTPLLGLDVWEHAYYLKYQNRRPDYIAAWWDVVDWNAVAARYAAG